MASPTMASPSNSAGLRIHNLDLNREQWENVPTLVHKSFHVVNANIVSMKKWADKQEERQKQLGDVQQQFESRIGATDAALNSTQVKLQELNDRLANVYDQFQAQSNTFGICLRQILYATRYFWEKLGNNFGLDLAIGDSERQLLMAAEAVTPQDLEALGQSLEGSLDTFSQCFEVWGVWRKDLEEKQKSMQSGIEELASAAENTRHRLLVWREMLRENANAVDALSVALGTVQGDVRDIKTTQVRQEDVDETVGVAAQQLQELLGATEARLDDVNCHVEAHVMEVGKAVSSLRQRTEERIEEYNNRVGQLLERHLNPVNAYLNAMHVKVDGVRVDVDSLAKDMPELAGRLETVGTKLQNWEGDSKAKDDELGCRIEGLSDAAEEQQRLNASKREEIISSVADLREEFGNKVGDLSSFLQSMASDLENLRKGELFNVQDGISVLEQKVAKWIHAHPLPAKISEARLYALEARLAEEMDARLMFEETIKGKSDAGLALPNLKTPRMKNGGGVPPSIRKHGSKETKAGYARPIL
mmetsp:Transcript_29807/g.81783  ORF Transcript_29807/g.81783 Transcript_29807/m.81783 type:complete len:532 (-) Transcript_29807:151-1746(-)|eukprot:CAMPEP_0117564614 /NCGR_PEP_ID=MMETSP0784-20121206/56128_1 /TAXON_ID=39447 /ORGANISM="" /LENGTH=531 /DNA_ID=CAMNT_0005362351 /DNA_START=88 /DNA_END=1683 /DNA_ORIENTATION=+